MNFPQITEQVYSTDGIENLGHVTSIACTTAERPGRMSLFQDSPIL